VRFLSPVFVIALILLFAGTPCFVHASEGGGGHGGSKEEKKDESKSKKKEAATITGGETPEDPVYLHLAPVTFPIIDDDGAQQIVTLLVDIHASDRPKAEEMQKNMPRMKDAILQALYGGMSDGSMRNAQMLDMAKVKASILKTVKRVFGDDFAQDALIQAVAQRKL